MNTWSLSWNGLFTVIMLETRLRIRSKRWLTALGAWFCLIGAITGLIIWAARRAFVNSCGTHCIGSESAAGPVAFAVIAMFVLGMGLITAPAFTGTAINAHRNQGTLARLQATRLSALEIVAGKLVAAWCTAVVFLITALPFILVSITLGNISFWEMTVCFVVAFAMVAVVCAIGLGYSSLFNRPSVSGLLTYATTAALAIISPLVMMLTVPFTQGEVSQRVWGLADDHLTAFNVEVGLFWSEHPDGQGDGAPVPPVDKCQWYDRTYTTTRTDYTWWVLVGNPFVIVADAAPSPPAAIAAASDALLIGDPFDAIRQGVRQMRIGPLREVDECTGLYAWNPDYEVVTNLDGTLSVLTRDGARADVPAAPVRPRPIHSDYPVWPWGLLANLAIGASFFVVAVRRLRIPYDKLPPGTRVS